MISKESKIILHSDMFLPFHHLHQFVKITKALDEEGTRCKGVEKEKVCWLLPSLFQQLLLPAYSFPSILPTCVEV